MQNKRTHEKGPQISVCIYEGTRSLSNRLKDNIKVHIREIKWDGGAWTEFKQPRI
jgi:hypothetical protein